MEFNRYLGAGDENAVQVGTSHRVADSFPLLCSNATMQYTAVYVQEDEIAAQVVWPALCYISFSQTPVQSELLVSGSRAKRLLIKVCPANMPQVQSPRLGAETVRSSRLFDEEGALKEF